MRFVSEPNPPGSGPIKGGRGGHFVGNLAGSPAPRPCCPPIIGPHIWSAARRCYGRKRSFCCASASPITPEESGQLRGMAVSD